MSHRNPRERFDYKSWFERNVAKRTVAALAARDAEFAEKHAETPLAHLAQYVGNRAELLRHTPSPCEIDGGTFIEERFGGWAAVLEMAHLRPPIKEPKPAVQITEAQKALRRLCNGRPSAAVESQVLSLLNGLAAAPEQIKPQPQTVNRGELAEVERRFSAALATSPVDEDGAKELALRLAGMQYNAIGGSEYESQRLRHLFTGAAPMAEINAELLKSSVSQVYVKKGRPACC